MKWIYHTLWTVAIILLAFLGLTIIFSQTLLGMHPTTPGRCKSCRALGQPRSSQRNRGKEPDDEELLTERIITLAGQYGRYGYRRITAMLQREGWQVNHKRVERIWCQEGLKVPAKQPKRGRFRKWQVF
jgi:hypothetical protein